MKKIFLRRIVLSLTMIALATHLLAQDHKVELTPFGGYLLGGSVKFYEGKFKVEDAACFGANLAVQVRSGAFIELGWTGMETQGNWKPYYDYSISIPETTVDMGVHYFHIGSVNELPLDNEAIRPYGTASLGATWFNVQADNADDEWLFSVAAGLGLKYFFNEKIGIRVQARLLLPVIYNGGGFYLGTGGSGMYVSSTAPIVQGDFTGGLIIALGEY